MKGDRRSALFIQNNLELLGFGSHRDALVQTVKELFENGIFNGLACLDQVRHPVVLVLLILLCARPALDATQASSASSSLGGDAALEMLRIHVRENPQTGFVDIVCADTGSGIRTHEIAQLCCGIFETTKARSARRGTKSSGKYGLQSLLFSMLTAGSRVLVLTTRCRCRFESCCAIQPAIH